MRFIVCFYQDATLYGFVTVNKRYCSVIFILTEFEWVVKISKRYKIDRLLTNYTVTTGAPLVKFLVKTPDVKCHLCFLLLRKTN